jgi:hypothetical protein
MHRKNENANKEIHKKNLRNKKQQKTLNLLR